MTEAEHTPTATPALPATRQPCTAEQWAELQRDIAHARSAYETSGAETKAAEPSIRERHGAGFLKSAEWKAREDADDAALDAYDALIVRALLTPAPHADAVRWKLSVIAERCADDNTWEKFERAIAPAMSDALRFVR